MPSFHWPITVFKSFGMRKLHETALCRRFAIGYHGPGRWRTRACHLPCDSFSRLVPRGFMTTVKQHGSVRCGSQAMSKTESGRASTSALFSPVALACSRPAAQLCVFCMGDACRGLEVVGATMNNSLQRCGDDCETWQVDSLPERLQCGSPGRNDAGLYATVVCKLDVPAASRELRRGPNIAHGEFGEGQIPGSDVVEAVFQTSKVHYYLEDHATIFARYEYFDGYVAKTAAWTYHSYRQPRR